MLPRGPKQLLAQHIAALWSAKVRWGWIDGAAVKATHDRAEASHASWPEKFLSPSRLEIKRQASPTVSDGCAGRADAERRLYRFSPTDQAVRPAQKKSRAKRLPRPGSSAPLCEDVFLLTFRVRRPAEAAEEAEAEPGKCSSPGSPIHPGTSASPEAAAEAAAEEVAVAAAVQPRRNCRPGSAAGCAS